MEWRRTRKFSKELKRLTKKYPSLPNDIAKLEPVLETLPQGNGSKHWNRLHASLDGSVTVFKVRLACVSLKGRSLFRVIYACQSEGGEVVRIDLIELYYKGERENEDRNLIQEYIDDCESLFT